MVEEVIASQNHKETSRLGIGGRPWYLIHLPGSTNNPLLSRPNQNSNIDTIDKMTSMMQVDKDIDTVETATAPKLGTIDEVTMHPLVLLSAADHYHRVARGTRKRVVGVLLGMVSKGVVDCTNSFAVPFEEDSRNAVRSRM